MSGCPRASYWIHILIRSHKITNYDFHMQSRYQPVWREVNTAPILWLSWDRRMITEQLSFRRLCFTSFITNYKPFWFVSVVLEFDLTMEQFDKKIHNKIYIVECNIKCKLHWQLYNKGVSLRGHRSVVILYGILYRWEYCTDQQNLHSHNLI